MSNLGVNDGHTISGPGSGAVGRISESEHTRLVGAEVRRQLSERGNKVYNCTVDYSNTTSENLSLIVSQANRQDLDWFVSIHFNAGGGRGVEVYTYEGRQYQDAIDVCKNISDVLGIPNRGVKAGTGLYVIRKTKAKSMLIEVCFVDTDDAETYLKVGHVAIATAIANALCGHLSNQVETAPVVTSPTVTDYITVAKNYLGTVSNTKKVQYLLNCFGYNLKVDGDCGKLTANAISAFQKKFGLGVDYKFGPNSFKAAYNSFVDNNVILRKGLKDNNYVRLIQFLLGISVDGAFGSQTDSAVRKYQGNNKLTVDGAVGKDTFKKILNI